MTNWTRIPAEVRSEADRRTLVGMLAEMGLEARIVKVKETPRGSQKRYVEYREQQKEDA